MSLAQFWFVQAREVFKRDFANLIQKGRNVKTATDTIERQPAQTPAMMPTGRRYSHRDQSRPRRIFMR
jgi:hypothetical protein